MKNKTPLKSVDTLYSEIKLIIDNGKSNAFRAVNFTMVQTYWHIGKLIVENEQHGEQKAEYGKELIEKLAKKLNAEFGRGFNNSNLWYMRQFFNTFKILHALRGELSWTHYRLLLKVESKNARTFYMEECVNCNWSTRTLERQINCLYFERMILTKGNERKSLVKKEAKKKKIALQPKDYIKDPYVLDFLDLKPNTKFYEHELEQAIIDKLQDFLLELGRGFSFVARQQRVSLEGDHFYIDLVFYNYILKCFLLIDLKTGKLTHQDVGQMDMYVRIFEDTIRQENDNPTIGLILCADKNKTIAKYSLLNDNKQIFASKYKTYLPSEKELTDEIARERDMLELEIKLKN